MSCKTSMQAGTLVMRVKKEDQHGGIEHFAVGTDWDVFCVLVEVGLVSMREVEQ